MIDLTLKYILKYSKTNEEIYLALKDLRKKAVKLQNRSTCPLCNEKLSFFIYDKEIKNLDLLINKYFEKYRQDKIDFREKMKPIWENKAREQQDYKIKVEKYRIENKNKLNKCIRTLILPNIPEIEKQLWNDAIEIQFDKRNLDELEDCYFKL